MLPFGGMLGRGLADDCDVRTGFSCPPPFVPVTLPLLLIGVLPLLVELFGLTVVTRFDPLVVSVIFSLDEEDPVVFSFDRIRGLSRFFVYK